MSKPDDDDTKPRPTDITGNAATATKLRTARLINNLPFDGTTDIRVVDLSGAFGSDGKLLPTQRTLTASVQSLQSNMDKGFAQRDINLTTAQAHLQTEIDSTNSTLDKFKTTTEEDFKHSNDNLSDMEKRLRKIIDNNTSDIQTIDATNDVEFRKIHTQLDSNTTILKTVKLPLGEGQSWRRAYTMDQAYRVNSTGRTIELRVQCGTAAADCLFRILTLDGTTPVELDRLYLTTETKLGTISCIIPPDAWWAINYDEGIGANIAPMVLQDRPDIQTFQEYYSTVNSNVRYIIDTFGSENHYKGSDWREY